MALKRKITKDAFDKLSKDLQDEYKADGDRYVLDIDGGDELLRAIEHEKTERVKFEALAKELGGKVTKLESEKSASVQDLETKYKSERDTLVSTHAAQLEAKNSFLKNTLIESVAKDIANENFTNSVLAMPHIKSRLDVDLTGETPIVVVKDQSGKPTKSTIQDLAKEFVDNKDFSTIIKGSKASGGGAPQNQIVGSGAPGSSSQQTTRLQDMSPAERVAMIDAKKGS